MINITNKITKVMLLSFSLLASIVYAQSENISIKFENGLNSSYGKDDNTYTLSAKLLSYEMNCKGRDNAYSVSNTTFDKGTDLTDDKKLIITVDGPYEGDKRNTCTTKNDNVYFTLSNLVVNFDYKGRQYKCYIMQNIGPSYDTTTNSSDKLQGDEKDKDINCDSSNNSPFNYKLIAGERSKSGYISIHRNLSVSSSSSARINIFSFNPDITNYFFNSAKMKCSGLNSAYSINSYSDIDSLIEVNGLFQKDDRATCVLPTDNMYYILESGVINFDYKEEHKVCKINAQFGTSYDTATLSYNKLQSYIPENPFGKGTKEAPNECVDAPGFFYRIIQGNVLLNLKYNPGYIELYKGSYERPNKYPLTWNLYVNGMNNSIDDAMASSLVVSSLGAISTDNAIQYGLLYNQTSGSVSDFADLAQMKTFDDVLARGDYIPAYEQIYGNCPALSDPAYEQCQEDALNWYLSVAYSSDGAEKFGLNPNAIFGKSFDTVWGSFINYGIESTDRITLIAHSQGNLYANTLINYLITNKNFSRNNLNSLQVGVTSTVLSAKADDLFKQVFPESMPLYVTNVEDEIINLWRFSVIAFGGVAPVPGNLGYKGELYLDSTNVDNKNHGFVNAYLNHKSTKDAITNLLASYTMYNELMLNSLRPAQYTGIYVYAISKKLQSKEGYAGYLFDGSYSETSANPNFKIYKDVITKPLDLSNDIYMLLKDPSNNIKSFELKSFGNYIFDVSDTNIRYVISNTNASNTYCKNEPYIMILSSTTQKVICNNTKNEVPVAFTSINSIGVDLTEIN